MRPVGTLAVLEPDWKTGRLEGTLASEIAPAEEGRIGTMHAERNLAAGPSASHSDVGVLIVDDQRVFRGALRDLIATAPGFVVIGEACSGEDAVHAVERLAPELVLMDVAMPGMGGLAAMRAILSRHPKLMVVLISANEPALDRAESVLPHTAAFVRKQDLRPRQLRLLWEQYQH
jgi:CheY-like chemotaxis protein